jgi:hypothetical protein
MFKPVEIFVVVFLFALIAIGLWANVSRNDERAFRYASCSGRNLEAYKVCVSAIDAHE